MAIEKKVFCVISHTHWDREWYMPFEEFRVKLVDLIDRLFVILDENPEYIFHFDAQTIVLEDYLEIRPGKKDLLKKYIQSGNILIGPWYLQNDFYLTSGEATVRNLLKGKKVSREFGEPAKAGYAPDQFGNISQLPRILQEFGIDNFIFGRGYGKYLFDDKGEYIRDENGRHIREKTPTEFIWEGPDGSKLLAIHMKYWYNNAQRIYPDTKDAVKLLETIDSMFHGFASTPYLLLMNGVDHLEAQDDLLPIIGEVNKNLPEGQEMRQISMETYLDNVKKYIKDFDISLKTHKGELRDGHDWELLKGTLSSRVYLKQQNVRAQGNLERILEPASSIFEISGAGESYDKDYLDYLWTCLLKNHPHDSICGCSRDEVHAHMEDLYQRIDEASGALIERKLKDIATHSQVYDWSADENIIALINTQSLPWKGLMPAQIIYLQSENAKGFRLETADGEDIPFVVTSVTDRKHDVFTALNLPGVLDVRVFDILMKAPEVQGFAVRGIKVISQDKFTGGEESHEIGYISSSNADTVIETNDIKVIVTPEGRIDFLYKKDNKLVERAISIEETADIGDAYVYRPVKGSRARYSDEFPAEVKKETIPGFRSAIKVTYNMELPIGYSSENRGRKEETVLCPVEVSITAEDRSDLLKLHVSFENNAENHRMRLLVDTGISSDFSFGDIPFDIVEHHVIPSYGDTLSPVQANTSLAGIEKTSDGHTGGVAIFTQGNHEYEHLLYNRSTLAFTLVRGNPYINVGDNSISSSGPKWNAPGNQCLRRIEADFAVKVFEGSKGNLPALSAQFQTPPLAVFSSCDYKKFSGGRFAIQGSNLVEFYYLPDPYPDVVIPDNKPLLKIEGDGIHVTALKKSEDNTGYILRVVNLEDKDNSLGVVFTGEIYKSDMEEKIAGKAESANENIRTFIMGKKEILSLYLKI